MSELLPVRIETTHKIILGATPQEADFAVTSIAYDGRPGRLNSYALEQCGYGENSQPSPKDLSKGYHIIQDSGKKPILFVVTVGTGNTRLALESNFRAGLIDSYKLIMGKTVWVPLMGTGAGGINAGRKLQYYRQRN